MALAPCGVITNQQGKELVEHGSIQFPVACYANDLTKDFVPWHWHDEWEALIIKEGTAMISTGSEKHIVHQGQGFFINAGEIHAAQLADTDKCRLISMVFHPRIVGGSMDSIFWEKYVQPFMERMSVRYIFFDCTQSWHRRALTVMETAWQEIVTESSGFELKARNSLSEFMYLIRMNTDLSHAGTSEREIRNAERMKKMLQYVQDHYSENMTIAQIAECVAISESECLRCFHRTLGVSPSQYIKQFRIHKAEELLLSTNDTIGNIGAVCGFFDAGYFTKVFREVKGTTPKEFRAGHSIR